jgi:hypothetical protein
LFYLGEPSPSVDYLAKINEPILQVSDDEKGWTVYRDLWIKHGFSEGGGFKSPANINDEENGWRLVRPEDGEAWTAATRRLAEIDDLLEGFRVGGVRPHFGVPYHADRTLYAEDDFRALFPSADYQKLKSENENKPANSAPSIDKLLISVLLPHVQVMRESARLLTVDTRWALEQQDTERATRNIEAMLGISQQVTEGKFLVCTLVGYAISGMALESIDECLHSETEFSDEQLGRIHAALVKCQVSEMIDYSNERAMFMDVVQHAYTDDGNGDGRITASGLELFDGVARFSETADAPGHDWTLENVAFKAIAPSSILFMATRKQLTDKADELFDRMEAGVDGMVDERVAREIEQEIKELPAGYTPLTLLFPALTQVQQATRRTHCNLEGARAALAVIRYQRKHGRYPDQLDDVVGEFLAKMPQDVMNNQPLNYRQDEQGFIIYSVGVNGTDDGGQAVMVDAAGEFVTVSNTVADADTDADTDTDGDGDQAKLRTVPTREYNTNNPDYPGDWILWPRQSHNE